MLYLIHQIIEQAADGHPDNVAVRCAGQELTYAELVQSARNLAAYLLEQSIRPGDRVGIYLNKSLESVIAVYGIMMAGGVYVPLDPFAPVDRLRYVIRDCGIRGLITADSKRNTLEDLLSESTPVEFLVGVRDWEGAGVRAVAWDTLQAADVQRLATVTLTEQDLAYILYTSGSTGTPKGIMHTHRSGLSFPLWAYATYDLRHDDRVSNHAPLHFDLSTFDLFATALAHATMVIVPEAIAKFPANVAHLIERERISVWYSVPFALIQMLLKGGLQSRNLAHLRWVLFAGEPFPTKHLRDLMSVIPHARFSNLYGPTETNVCTYYHVPSLDPHSDEPIPIGRPCTNVDDKVIDADGKEVAEGETGELLIRGPIVMHGYWGRPELSERGFYLRDITPSSRGVYYRTGDLVQRLPDGNYRYLGRKDRQVKTRGYRVELDEIEVALLAQPWIEEAATYTVDDGQGSQLIRAAVTPAPGAELSVGLILKHLAERLPAYAIPTQIDILSEFPRTSTGKIDRRALQVPAGAA